MASEVSLQSAPLKAGHLPAVKAGGMRVSKKVTEDSGTSEKKKPAADKPSSIVNIPKVQTASILDGSLEKLHHDYTAESAQCAHQKPQPTVEKIVNAKKLNVIHQPRKC
ncbi:death-associated protein-like 1 [Hyperolius riggenbachi]|uniref:death-associated protein-like 1 n=1 Tax=Hyperolius riggenbachi TaxID=752182 RepID=UPI0035A2B9AB